MTSLKRVLSNIIHGRNDFCCLCFQELNEIDENNGNFGGVEIDIDMSEIFTFIFDSEIINTMSAIGTVCNHCNSKAIKFYKFMKMCRNNSHNLKNAITSIKDSFENTVEEIDSYNSLFVCLNTEDFTSQQYYDDMVKVPVRTIKTAAIRIHTLRTPKIISLTEIKTEISGNRQKSWKRLKTLRGKIEYDVPSIPTSSITFDGDTTCLQCKDCVKIFRNITKFRSHYFRTHYPRNVKCLKCPKRFISEEFLSLHMDEFHGTLVCSQCGKYFTNKTLLKKHEMSHNSKICCQECGRVYSSKEAFKKHKTDMVCQQKMRKTSDQAEYQCDICKKRYCYKPYLAKHIKYEHGKAEGFKCNFCNKKFYNPSNLRTHLVKHTHEKKFECPICNGRFGTKAALLYHTRLHTGEKPYQCDHCDKAFLSASRRLDHVRRHHMAPALECDICHSKFKATGSLLKHKKRHFNPNSRLNNVRFLNRDDEEFN